MLKTKSEKDIIVKDMSWRHVKRFLLKAKREGRVKRIA